MNTDELYIKRCLELAKKGIGTARPNPSVGAVVVVDGLIVGEGFTSSYGGNHAEVNAIARVKDKSVLPKATIYVTLEPCSHFGKTPPCADLIVRHKIPNVVIGCIDTNLQVVGKGVARSEKRFVCGNEYNVFGLYSLQLTDLARVSVGVRVARLSAEH